MSSTFPKGTRSLRRWSAGLPHAQAHTPSQSQTAAEAGRPASAEFCPYPSQVKGGSLVLLFEESGPDCVHRFTWRTLRSALPQLANSRCTWCPSAPAFRAPRPARRSRSSGPPSSNLGTPGKLHTDPHARLPPAVKSRFPRRTARARFCAAAPSPAPQLTWGLAALSAASGASHPGVGVRKGARSAAGRPRVPRDPVRAAGRTGRTRGARSAPAAAGPARAPVPITALRAGRGAQDAGSLSGPRAAQTPGPERASGRARVRREGERASGRAQERRRGRAGAGPGGRERRRSGWSAAGACGQRRAWRDPRAAEPPAPPGARARALCKEAAPPPRAHSRARTPALHSSAALLTARCRPSPSRQNPGER